MSVTCAGSVNASLLVHPDVQRRPHQAELFLEERDGHQGNHAIATKQSLLLGAQGQVGGSQPVGNADVRSTVKDLAPLSDRLIYFGGYGCKTMGEMQNTPATNFIVEELSWVIGSPLEEPLSPAHG